MSRRVIVEADGGSRGNPGPAAYGALVRDAETGEVIAERGESIGIATNNVAEYRGLIAGLELVREHAPDADVEVRMDSKLVIEQMAGRWKIKHVDMKPLALQAQRLVSGDITWTWVPRASNKAADALVNEALDTATGSVRRDGRKEPVPERSTSEQLSTTWAKRPAGEAHHRGHAAARGHRAHRQQGLQRAWRRRPRPHRSRPRAGPPCRGPAGQARTDRRDRVVAVAAHPRDGGRRRRGAGTGRGARARVRREASFGEWDGLAFFDIMERWPDDMRSWLDSPDGRAARRRVARRRVRAGRRGAEAPAHRLRGADRGGGQPRHADQDDAASSPSTPRWSVIQHFELAPASITTVQWWSDGWPVVYEFSAVPD